MNQERRKAGRKRRIFFFSCFPAFLIQISSAPR
jgi:hypothetical protein